MKSLSVAPKERINIRFVPATGDQQEEIELPLKTVILGDFKGVADDSPVEERKAVSIDKNTFTSVMKEMELHRQFEVSNKLQDDDPDATLNISLDFETLSDFKPDAVAQKVPELRKLVELRDALSALKGPLGNMPQFRKALSEMMDDPEKREEMLSELAQKDSQDS